MAVTKNTHDVNNLIVTDKEGKLRVLAPGEECETFERKREEAAPAPSKAAKKKVTEAQ